MLFQVKLHGVDNYNKELLAEPGFNSDTVLLRFSGDDKGGGSTYIEVCRTELAALGRAFEQVVRK